MDGSGAFQPLPEDKEKLNDPNEEPIDEDMEEVDPNFVPTKQQI